MSTRLINSIRHAADLWVDSLSKSAKARVSTHDRDALQASLFQCLHDAGIEYSPMPKAGDTVIWYEADGEFVVTKVDGRKVWAHWTLAGESYVDIDEVEVVKLAPAPS